MDPDEKLKPSLFCDLYKASIQFDQNKRREQLLAEQRSRRNGLLDEARGIVASNTDDSEASDFLKAKLKHRNENFKEYKNRIMLSEWMLEVAPDFDVSWFMKICPSGHRNLVVAHNNTTKTYSKTGRFEYKFKSELPCGNNGSKKTILDCIWSSKTKTFYVLDVLMWADYDLTECEAEFRFFWLQSKMMETPELQIKSTNNEYIFQYVPHTECDFSVVRENLDKFPVYTDDTPQVDGLLFYHKEASYTAGRTPLVGWLKPFMVPEILNIPVAAEYMIAKPEKYVSLAEHIRYSESTRKKKHQNITNVEMDIS